MSRLNELLLGSASLSQHQNSSVQFSFIRGPAAVTCLPAAHPSRDGLHGRHPAETRADRQVAADRVKKEFASRKRRGGDGGTLSRGRLSEVSLTVFGVSAWIREPTVCVRSWVLWMSLMTEQQYLYSRGSASFCYHRAKPQTPARPLPDREPQDVNRHLQLVDVAHCSLTLFNI